MVAIVSKQIRVNNAGNFLADVGTDSTYLYIGRSQQWPSSDTAIATPVDTVADKNNVHQNMIALKKVAQSDVSHCITRYNWLSGTTYIAYDDQLSSLGSSQYYVITDELNIYKCLQAGAGASVVKPTGQTVNAANAIESDGYVWKFMYTLSGTQATKFLTNSFIPVNILPTDDGSLQFDVQTGAQNGSIHRVLVTAGGSGYTSTPTVTITGNGSSATAAATVVGGVVTAISMSNIGSGYNEALVAITGGGGTGAVARAIISPPGGHGANAADELGAFFMMCNVNLDSAEGSGDFPIDNDFRQLGLIRNPFNYGTTTKATASTLQATRSLVYASLAGGAFAVDQIITGGTSGAQAYITSIDVGTNTVRYHQDESTGYGVFQTSETISNASSVTATISSLGNPEVAKFTGEVLYIENRSAVARANSQIEDIKLVLEF
jgi:hypothetical protein